MLCQLSYAPRRSRFRRSGVRAPYRAGGAAVGLAVPYPPAGSVAREGGFSSGRPFVLLLAVVAGRRVCAIRAGSPRRRTGHAPRRARRTSARAARSSSCPSRRPRQLDAWPVLHNLPAGDLDGFGDDELLGPESPASTSTVDRHHRPVVAPLPGHERHRVRRALQCDTDEDARTKLVPDDPDRSSSTVTTTTSELLASVRCRVSTSNSGTRHRRTPSRSAGQPLPRCRVPRSP